jgi:TPR repeat protein
MAFTLLVTAIVPVSNAQGFQTAAITEQPNTKSNSPKPAVAITNWRDAAERGSGSAQFMLGLYNAKRQDTPQNLVKEYVWFKLSASNYALSKVLLKHVEGQLTKDKIGLGKV